MKSYEEAFECLTLLKEPASLDDVDAYAERFVDHAPPHDRQLAAKQILKLIIDFIKTLHPRYQKIFYYSFVEGMSYNEVGKKVNKCGETVRTDLAKIKNAIKLHLGETDTIFGYKVK